MLLVLNQYSIKVNKFKKNSGKIKKNNSRKENYVKRIS